MEIGLAKRAMFDDHHCGDECSYWQAGANTILCVVDGLGHGEHAERAAKAAVDYVARHLSESLGDIFAGCDLALRNTRGVAMGIARIEQAAHRLAYAAVNNVRAIVADKDIRTLHGTYGIVGAGYRTLTPQTMHIRPGNLVILHTDGVKESMDLWGYDDAFRADVQRLAQKIIEDWGRQNDDAAVLVYRHRGM